MRTKNGLTILEVLIMATVIGVVAAITIPKFIVMSHRSREADTKGNLGDLRGALAIYYSDNFGLYPSDAGTPETRLSSAIVPKYIKSMPAVTLTHVHPRQATVQDVFDDGGDWYYTMLNGFVAVNCTHADTRGEPVSGW